MQVSYFSFRLKHCYMYIIPFQFCLFYSPPFIQQQQKKYNIVAELTVGAVLCLLLILIFILLLLSSFILFFFSCFHPENPEIYSTLLLLFFFIQNNFHRFVRGVEPFDCLLFIKNVCRKNIENNGEMFFLFSYTSLE